MLRAELTALQEMDVVDHAIKHRERIAQVDA